MRAFLYAVLVSAFTVVSAGSALAGDKEAKKSAKKEAAAAAKGGEVTLKGTMVCGKCTLKKTDGCQNVLKVSEGGKDVLYFLAKNPVADEHHGPVCSGSKGATVKGTVADEGGKKTLTASEIKYE